MSARPDPSAAIDALVGMVIADRYRIVSALEEGGMGLVYVAESLVDKSRIAVKVLRHEFIADREVVARFLDEARAAQHLVHPNIIRIFGNGVTPDGTPYILLELLDGVPVNAYTKKGQKMPVAQAVHIVQGILAGLTVAHTAGIVHRDLKPANVFLSRNVHGAFEIKILDFGIAKVMDAAGGMGSKTRTGMFLGTPAYMSPEQIKSPKNVDARADLWAAGVMFYRMLTGKPPFSGEYEVDRLTAILNETQEPLEKIDPQLAPLSEFMTRALQKDRALRFQSAAEMSLALAHITQIGLPPVPSDLRAATTPAGGRPVRQLPLTLGILFIFVALAVGLVGGYALAHLH